MIHDSILGTIGNTPIVRLSRIEPRGTLYAKLESFNPLGSVKDRLALAVIDAAERDGSLRPGQTVIEATSGNTGIGLAMVCAARGYPLVIVMSEAFSVERRRMMRFLGARVVLTPASEKGSGMVEKARELAARHGWFWVRQFENPANPAVHEATTAREILDRLRGAATRLLRDRSGHRGHPCGRRTGAPETLAPDPHRRRRAREFTGARQRHPAGLPPGRLALRQPPDVPPAPGAGLGAGFRAGDRRSGPPGGSHRPCAADRRRRGPAPRPRVGPARGHLLRHLGRGDPGRGAEGGRERAQGQPHPVHGARHRRALSLDGALRGYRAGHGRRGNGDLELHPALPFRGTRAGGARPRSLPPCRSRPRAPRPGFGRSWRIRPVQWWSSASNGASSPGPRGASCATWASPFGPSSSTPSPCSKAGWAVRSGWCCAT